MAMKTSNQGALDKKAVPWNEERAKLSPEEMKAARAKYLLDDVRAKQLEERQKRAAEVDDIVDQAARHVVLREAFVKTLIDKGEQYSLVRADFNTKKMSIEYQIYRRPTDTLRDLIDRHDTTFMCNLPLWEGSTVETRQQAMAKHDVGLDPALAELGTIEPVSFLPEASKQWILDWQHHINTGAAFAVSPQIDEVADSLIKRGYCLVAPNAISHPETDHSDQWTQPGRDDMEPGSAGTPSFVRAMMGQKWLEWLLANERTGEEV